MAEKKIVKHGKIWKMDLFDWFFQLNENDFVSKLFVISGNLYRLKDRFALLISAYDSDLSAYYVCDRYNF